MMEKTIKIDRNSRKPLHLQIKDQIRDSIFQGRLLDGKSLPPTRHLAKQLGVNRSTVVSAYNELLAEDLIDSHVGRGTIVRKRSEDPLLALSDQPLHWTEHFDPTSRTIQDSILKDVLEQCAQEDIFSFAAGIPDPDTFPLQTFNHILRGLIDTSGKEVFTSLPTEGYYPLRQLLAEWQQEEGRPISPDETIVVSGAIQGLYLLTRILLSRGDTVVVERPTFMLALRIFQATGARIIDIPMDEYGMRLDILENLLIRQNPKFIYTLPTFQNPSGSVLSLERRKKLLELAYRHHVPVIEDDPYSCLFYGNVPPPSLRSMDKHNHVIYIGTFSKILFEGLRTGWVCAAKEVIEQVSREKQLMDLHSNTLAQYALYAFCQSGYLEKHLKKVRTIYKRKLDTMLSALQKYCSPFLEWNTPSGGYYVWCRLKNGLNSRDLLRELYEMRVAFLYGETFFQDGTGKEYFRLNFSSTPHNRIQEGIRRLQIGLQNLTKKGKKREGKISVLNRPIV